MRWTFQPVRAGQRARYGAEAGDRLDLPFGNGSLQAVPVVDIKAMFGDSIRRAVAEMKARGEAVTFNSLCRVLRMDDLMEEDDDGRFVRQKIGELQGEVQAIREMVEDLVRREKESGAEVTVPVESEGRSGVQRPTGGGGRAEGAVAGAVKGAVGRRALPVFCCGEYIYVKNRQHRDRVYYRCWNWVAGCKCTVIVDAAGDVASWGKRGQDAHLPNCGYNNYVESQRYGKEIKGIRSWIVLKARADPTMTPSQLYQLFVNQFIDRPTHSIAVTLKQVEYWLSVTRAPNKGVDTYEDLEMVAHPLAANIKMAWLRQNVTGPSGHMVFASDVQLDHLRAAPIWLIDGTFSAAPRPFTQVLNVMAVYPWVHEKYVPACHILLKRKDQTAYGMAIAALLNFTKKSLSLQEVITDFEEGLRNGIMTAFGENGIKIRCRGCLFHFSQALVRAWKKQGKTSIEQRKILRLLLWSPYMPIAMTKTFVGGLRSRNTGVEAFLKYFHDYWIRDRQSWWLVTDMDCDIVTNCAIESFHGKLKGRGGAARRPQLREISNMFLKLDHEMIAKQEYRALFGEFHDTKERRSATFRRIKERLEYEYTTLPSSFQPLADDAKVQRVDFGPASSFAIKDLATYMSKLFDDQRIPAIGDDEEAADKDEDTDNNGGP